MTTKRRPVRFPIRGRTTLGVPFGRRQALLAQRRQPVPAQKRRSNKPGLSRATRLGGSRRISRSCRSWCGSLNGCVPFHSRPPLRAAVVANGGVSYTLRAQTQQQIGSRREGVLSRLRRGDRAGCDRGDCSQQNAGAGRPGICHAPYTRVGD